MLKDLKLSKKSKKDMADKCMPCDSNDERAAYPYGTVIRLESETLKKFPMLMDTKPGDVIGITAQCSIKSIRLVDPKNKDTYEDQSVEIQITKMELDLEDDLDSAFNED